MMSQLLDDLLLPPDAASSNDNDTSVDYINDASFFKLFLPEFVIMQQKRRGCNQTWLMSCVCETRLQNSRRPLEKVNNLKKSTYLT